MRTLEAFRHNQAESSLNNMLRSFFLLSESVVSTKNIHSELYKYPINQLIP